jgi:hypothetical protein
MDPQATWNALAKAIQAGDTEEAAMIADDLYSWLCRGGFPPKITGLPIFDAIVARATCEGICEYDV